MFFIKASPNQYLVSGKDGRIVNRGLAASSFRWPGYSFIKVPSSQQEADFQMTQESSDGIPLRFKGLIIYRIVRPQAAARLFDFSTGHGLDQIHQMLSHLCLGELRACAASMTMQRCVEERKTTLTGALRKILQDTVDLTEDNDWGLQIEVVQVAQVFVTDPELRAQLEAEARDEIRSQSQLSALRADGKLTLARAEAERVALEQSLELSREKARVEQEEQGFALQMQRLKAEHEHRLKQEALERETPLKRQEIAAEMELAEEARKLTEVQGEAEQLRTEYELKIAKKKQDLRKEILALEQAPQIAQSLSGMLSGAQLHFWGEEPGLLGPVTNVLNSLSEAFTSKPDH
jgi:hypothetical protein